MKSHLIVVESISYLGSFGQLRVKNSLVLKICNTCIMHGVYIHLLLIYVHVPGCSDRADSARCWYRGWRLELGPIGRGCKSTG